MAKKLFLFLLIGQILQGIAQELNATVIVNSDQVTDGRLDKNIQNDLQRNISSFINNYKWTEHTYQASEKIKCTFQININSFAQGGTKYGANVQIAASRPIYNTTYETPIFSFLDQEWQFDYSQSSAINYNENAYVNSLSSLISYYVYLILAHDYDSYAKLGGTQYLEKAQQIMNSAQSGSEPGWKSTDSPNSRYWIIENLINPQQQVLREISYKYHRMSLDKFTDNPEKGRETVLKCLEDLKQMTLIRPSTLTVRWFFNTKRSELISLFSKAPQEMKQKTFDLLREMDPTHAEKYADIMKNN